MLKKNKDNSETPEGRKARRPSFSPFKPRDKQPNFILSVLCHTVCILLVVVLVFVVIVLLRVLVFRKRRRYRSGVGMGAGRRGHYSGRRRR